MDDQIDLLAFSPHPDDAEIGCAGALLLAADSGLRVAVADLSGGERASRGTPEQRARERARATELLGLHRRFSVGLPDTEIGLDPSHRLAVIELIRIVRPAVILAPYWVERHPDHEAASQLVRAAYFLAGVASLGTGRPHRPRHLYYYMIHSPSFAPSFVVDVSPVWERRMAALRAYGSQVTDESGGMVATGLSRPEFLRYLEARYIYFGALVGAAYGEPYFSPAPLPSPALPGLERRCGNEGTPVSADLARPGAAVPSGYRAGRLDGENFAPESLPYIP